MTFAEFQASQQRAQAPAGLAPCLLALWHAGRGEWHAAHDLLQDLHDTDAAWIHAYLHREEGDLSNARYWYHQAQQPFPAQQTLAQEYAAIAQTLLGAMNG